MGFINFVEQKYPKLVSSEVNKLQKHELVDAHMVPKKESYLQDSIFELTADHNPIKDRERTAISELETDHCRSKINI